MGYCARLAVLAVVVQLGLISVLYARTMYVSDTFEIVVRSQKEVGRNIVKILPTGTSVEVLETDESWATIQLPDDRTGYVLKRYLIARLPHKVVAERIRAEAEELRAQLQTAEQQLNALRDEHQTVQQASADQQGELSKISQQYEALRKDAAQYLQLKADYNVLQDKYSAERQQFTTLRSDYEALKKSRNVMWFLSGGGVILAGWIIGMITERLRGRRRQSGHAYQLPN
jgi:SH3 domain protein